MEQLYIICLGMFIASLGDTRGVWSHGCEKAKLVGGAVYNMEIDSKGQNAFFL